MDTLFCTDGSKISYTAIINFSHWFKAFKTDVLSTADFDSIPEGIAFENNDFVLKCKNSVDSILQYSREYLNEKNIIVSNLIKTCGNPIDSILEAEKDNNYQTIILGSNGKKGIQKWLGSVSQEIASLSKSSVYISKGNNSFQKILFAIDYTNDINSFENTIEKMKLEDKEIHILNVYEMPDLMFLEGQIDPNWAVDIEKKQIKSGLMLLNSIEELFTKKGLKIYSSSVHKGIATAEILKYCKDRKIDLVVTSMRPSNNKPKFMMNSVSKRILEHTQSDVFILKQAEKI